VSERHRNLGQMNNKDGMKIESLLQRKNKDFTDELHQSFKKSKVTVTSVQRTLRCYFIV
jgi:hypothetical protein